jgi:hypothetical protein
MYRRGVSKSRHKGPENRAFWHYANWRSSHFASSQFHKGNRIAVLFTGKKCGCATLKIARPPWGFSLSKAG